MTELLTIPLIAAIVEVLKQTGLPNKYAAIVAVLTGVAVAATFMEADLKQELAVGLVLGLSASGLYSGGKALITK